MNTKGKTELSDFSDREMLELIFSTVQQIERKVNRIDEYLLSKDKKYVSFLNNTSDEDDVGRIVTSFHRKTEHAFKQFLRPD